ncbi:MAG TPA: hypothetical protein VI299_06810 [Polyangiales bacterium]
MIANAKYLAFGLVVLAAYWLTARSGYVFFSDDGRPSPPSMHAGGPTFWGTGYQGGK